jgi:hypothetical protein
MNQLAETKAEWCQSWEMNGGIGDCVVTIQIGAVPLGGIGGCGISALKKEPCIRPSHAVETHNCGFVVPLRHCVRREDSPNRGEVRVVQARLISVYYALHLPLRGRDSGVRRVSKGAVRPAVFCMLRIGKPT